MSMPRLGCALLFVILVLAPRLSAQTLAAREHQDPVAIVLITESDRVRFTTPRATLEWRLEVMDAQNQPIFDSGLVSGKALDWPLTDPQGQAVESALYSYTLTIQRGASEASVQRGQLHIERIRSVYQISALSGDAPGRGIALTVMDASASPTGPAAAAAAPTPTVAPTAESFRRSLGAVSFATVQPLISGSGTTFSMTRWLDGPSGIVGDANVTEQNGSVVVGNGSFKGNLQIFGGATEDVFAGMGPNLITGPGFNYGYAGSTFGRSAGFFNVRPDASAVAPNPSLRFMTANAQRMIITNLGHVGIGVSNPMHRLQVVNSNGRDGTIQVGSNELWSSGDFRQVFFGDSGLVAVGEWQGDDILTLRGFDVNVMSAFLRPSSDNATDLGTAARRWTTVYAVNGTINTSDARLKHDIRTLDDSLASVLKLRPVSFAWKNATDSRRHLGLVAQEVEPVLPQVVHRDANPDAPLGIAYADLVPVVIKAIQEQQATLDQQGAAIASLQTENAALRQRNHELDARLTALERTLRLVLSK